MSLLLVVHLVLVAAYAGFQWTVRGLVYPQFALVGEGFTRYERAHQQRVSRVVGPLFAGLGVSTLWLLAVRLSGAALDGVPLAGVLGSAGCLAVVLAVTALGAVPLHRRLGTGWDAAAHARLLRVDSVRVAAASANVLLAGWLVLA